MNGGEKLNTTRVLEGYGLFSEEEGRVGDVEEGTKGWELCSGKEVTLCEFFIMTEIRMLKYSFISRLTLWSFLTNKVAR